MAEWLKAHAWKACLGETLTRVRIPLSPPFRYQCSYAHRIANELAMDDSIRFAGQAGISSLYRYQDFPAGPSCCRLVDILRNHRVYCSDPLTSTTHATASPSLIPLLSKTPLTARRLPNPSSPLREADQGAI